MATELNNYVDFKWDFARPKVVDGLPVEPLGAELATFLANRLPGLGIEVLTVDKSEEGSYLICRSNASTIELMVSFDYWDMEDARWSILVCRKRTFWGKSNYPEVDVRGLLYAVDKILKESGRITDIRWFPGFETSDYLSLMRPSDGPIRCPDLDQDLPFALRLDRFSRRLANVYLPCVFIGGLIIVALFGRTFPKLPSVFGGVCTIMFLVALFVLPIAVGRFVHHAAQQRRQQI